MKAEVPTIRDKDSKNEKVSTFWSRTAFKMLVNQGK